MTECIYYSRFFLNCNSWIQKVIEVYVPVDQVFRFEFIHEPAVAFKPSVAWILLVVYAFGRSMGKKYVKIPAVADFI